MEGALYLKPEVLFCFGFFLFLFLFFICQLCVLGKELQSSGPWFLHAMNVMQSIGDVLRTNGIMYKEYNTWDDYFLGAI